jgi:endoglucanase
MRIWRAAMVLCCAAFVGASALAVPHLAVNERGYFSTGSGLDVIVFSDIYPEGHQTGVTIIQHGRRVAANGDLRLEVSPGQWSPVPRAGERRVDAAGRRISQALSYPDPERNGRGFNPTFYPDLNLSYRVNVTALEGDAFRISVDLDRPIPREWVGRIGFNLELFPGHLFGKSFLMDGEGGSFPRQPNGPMIRAQPAPGPAPRNLQANGPVPLSDEPLTAPLATGRVLTIAPDDESLRMRIESRSGEIALLDGRANHNNGWFIVRGAVPAGATTNAIEWIVTPNVIPGYTYSPVIQVSQVGYATHQPKRAVVELDAASEAVGAVRLYRLTETGREQVLEAAPQRWGAFLRYQYVTFDFSGVTRPGLYVVAYGDAVSNPFRIGDDIYARHVWQPTLEYFLPAQMCHMRVSERYRIWHGVDHLDDALMAPVGLNHFDGYAQGPSTLTRFRPGEVVPGLTPAAGTMPATMTSASNRRSGQSGCSPAWSRSSAWTWTRRRSTRPATRSRSTRPTAAATRSSKSSMACSPWSAAIARWGGSIAASFRRACASTSSSATPRPRPTTSPPAPSRGWASTIMAGRSPPTTAGSSPRTIPDASSTPPPVSPPPRG